MYGITHAVVTSLGCSPALGFVHSGHELSFVLDIADLYKTEIGIPVAFDVAAQGEEDVGPRTPAARCGTASTKHPC
jgi:CRISPR-associated protein Cas1